MKKVMEPKVLAESFVNHALPMIVLQDLEKNFLALIKKGLPVEEPIFIYQTTRLLEDPNSIAEGFSTKVSTLAREHCDCLPCGTPIGKATSGWAALELLGTILGPNIRVSKKEEVIDRYASFIVLRVALIASLQDKPLKRSGSADLWWPHADKVTVVDGKVIWSNTEPI